MRVFTTSTLVSWPRTVPLRDRLTQRASGCTSPGDRPHQVEPMCAVDTGLAVVDKPVAADDQDEAVAACRNGSAADSGTQIPATVRVSC